jgi:hypothetical protein
MGSAGPPSEGQGLKSFGILSRVHRSQINKLGKEEGGCSRVSLDWGN